MAVKALGVHPDQSILFNRSVPGGRKSNTGGAHECVGLPTGGAGDTGPELACLVPEDPKEKMMATVT
jgi:hypothetical protein